MPVDPADVRKVVPPGDLTLVGKAHDVALAVSAWPPFGFLMYPQAETAPRQLDCLEPDQFRYAITTGEITA